ncbi:hypothetical protein BJF81_02350 [Ornithinimicrobium sp. CNJ-824]|uniref:hypothetical protein n=1 Tax=Ornithinimicrobium sp. CNJ-824 TaxID=1904966 RepID=UPI000961C874|nr:hypothetical protein [Ornithinimicrobium sp. CNJ-824]OLT21403.1 hypothetical protein BJF81_02350 [Ornithinimicrobium sp. CNJ-824]
MTEDYRDELTGWRLYYLHRGRLCAPFVGDLSPVEQDEQAVCVSPIHGTPSGEQHDPPALGCYCGWRIADNLDALRPAVPAICEPARKVPVRDRLLAENPRRVHNPPWNVPDHVLAHWDWPAPALVRVRGAGGVRRVDDVAERQEELEAHFEGTGLELIREGRGMWRAARVLIVGPIITGLSPDPARFWPRETYAAADHYGVSVHVAAQTFPEVFERVAAGWMPPPALCRTPRLAVHP